MENLEKCIRCRRSVRTYDGRALSAEDTAKLTAFLVHTENPFGLPVCFKFLSAKENGLNCPVVSGTDLYLGGKIQKGPHANEAFGYSLEKLVLYAQSLGIGTVWLGGTMNRAAYEAAMELEENEMMPCATPLGYPAEKMSLKETLMRKTIKADGRMGFEELFFEGGFETPLTAEQAGALAFPLEMIRPAPSAVNRQPWRVIRIDNALHFYLKRSKGFSGADLDMQKIDMGIALCHFDLAAEKAGLNLTFRIEDPLLTADAEYIASFLVH